MQPFSENTVNVPAFLSKLWKMVNDPSTDHLICWSPAGNSFIIQNQAQFWYELLPLYYKHNNMSSFVRQLNMYGFHKISTFENGTMDNDKGEIQFFHQYFQKDLPELLKNIKRKVTTTKSENVPQNIVKTDELAKVLSDVKYLRNRQANVDSQLSAMKQENAVLWRELAMLRQKHLKQQQIVNKLIQFLVTLVQPNTRMNGLSVKRRFPLMLNESPNNKRQKTKNKDERIGDGPVIHELDNAEIIPDELLIDDPSQIQVQSPETPNTASTTSAKDANSPAPSSVLLEEADPIDSELFWDNPELVYIDKENENQNPLITEDFLNTAANLSSGDALTVTQQDNTNVAAVSAATSSDNQKVFLNPSTQDTLLSNLINGNYNTNAINGKGTNSNKTLPKENTNKNSLVAVSSRDPNLGYTKLNSATTPGTNDCFSEDLDVHVESTQSELEQLKELLNSASFVDANALLGLFADDTPDYVITYNGNKEQPENADDTLISGSELATYDNCQIDFSELFDTSDVNETAPQMPSDMNTFEESVNTPQEVKSAPLFPTGVKINKK